MLLIHIVTKGKVKYCLLILKTSLALRSSPWHSLVTVPLLDDVAGDGRTSVGVGFLPFEVHEVAVEVHDLKILGCAWWIC